MSFNNCPLCNKSLIKMFNRIVCNSIVQNNYHYVVIMSKIYNEYNLVAEYFVFNINNDLIKIHRNINGLYLHLPNYINIFLGSNEIWSFSKFNSSEKILNLMVLL